MTVTGLTKSFGYAHHELSGVLQRSCGRLDDDVWTVVSEADAPRDTVIAQFDLAAG